MSDRSKAFSTGCRVKDGSWRSKRSGGPLGQFLVQTVGEAGKCVKDVGGVVMAFVLGGFYERGKELIVAGATDDFASVGAKGWVAFEHGFAEHRASMVRHVAMGFAKGRLIGFVKVGEVAD